MNGEYRGADAIGDLMHDFFCRKSGEMRTPVLADRAEYLKSKEPEVTKMSYIVEELVKQAEKFRDIDTAAILLADNKVTEEYIETMFRAAPRLVTGVPRV